MYVGQCLVELNELEKAKEFINKELVIEDIREGEYSLSNIWIMLYKRQMAKELGGDVDSISDKTVLEKYPLPLEIDFRMH